ncbi:MAG: SIR2 family protein [Pseudomonadota bacterium]
MAELLRGIDRHHNPKKFKKKRKLIAKEFALRGRDVGVRKLHNVSDVLVRKLSIRRFVTLNYDLEIEWSLFLNEHEKSKNEERKRKKVWKSKKLAKGENATITHSVPSFGVVQSTTLSEREAATLFDFAIGKNRYRARVLHLHGRADEPESLIISRRDYRDRYWRAGLSRLPFEYGVQTIFAGNPVLFVGIGMSEAELTRVLEQVLSDNPNRRLVPMFILWNRPDDETSIEALRLLFYRKFGVHTLFDNELEDLLGKLDESESFDVDMDTCCELFPDPDVKGLSAKAREKKKSEHRKGIVKRATAAKRMDNSARLLATAAAKVQQHEWERENFRDPQLKLRDFSAKEPLTLWEYLGEGKETEPEFGMSVDQRLVLDQEKLEEVGRPERFVLDCLASGHPILPIVGAPGSGRGALVRVLRDIVIANSRPGDRIATVSGSFVTEMDSLFSVLSGAWDGRSAFSERISRISSTGKLSADIESSKSSRLIIVIAGMERFIAHDGSSLSNELDMLVRIIGKLGPEISHRFRLVLVGSPRLMRYLEIVCPEACRGAKHLVKVGAHSALMGWSDGVSNAPVPALKQKSYFQFLGDERRFNMKPLPGIRDTSYRRREFLARLTDQFGNQGEHDPKVLMEILRVLAFIGQPTEESVLNHAPSLRELTKDEEGRADIEQIRHAVKWLKSMSVVLKLKPYPESNLDAGDLIGLHKTLISEIRQRHGVPISDARLAAGFNVGLFVSQPIDSVVPDQEWHQELGELVDGLIGQFYDDDYTPEFCSKVLFNHGEEIEDELRLHFLSEFTSDELARMAGLEQSNCLRAALSLMRSYFSTPSLLMTGNRGLDPWVSDGPLTDHATRLSRLIRVYRQGVVLRQKIVGLAQVDETLEPNILEGVEKEVGPPPFYADDLAWLHNELGVVLLTQGKLFEANDALDTAEDLNDRFIEFGERHQNWRRIALNRIQIFIDMGRIEEAEELLRDIETATSADAEILCPASEACEGSRDGDCFRDYVLKYYCSKNGQFRGGRLDPTYPTDLILAEAMVIGYEGICYHLRGALEPGLKCLTDAVTILSHISEQRGYAFFQKHRASLLGMMGERKKAVKALQLCTAAAGPSRQTDIDHSGRIALAEYGIVSVKSSKISPSIEIIPQLRGTMKYAIDSDMYRLQLEAMQVRSFVHLQNGDAETALKYATDALAIACRYGFGLRKVSLRILLGKILAARKEVDAAKQMLETASRIATSMGYARAVAVAEDYLIGISEEEKGK